MVLESRLEEACLSGERILEDILPCLGDVEAGGGKISCLYWRVGCIGE